jgi:hypothetical protein
MRALLIILLVWIGATARAQAPDSFWGKYVNHTEVGGLFGRVSYVYEVGGPVQVENRTSLSLQTFNGYRLTDRLTTGISTGMDWYSAALLAPVAVGMRYDVIGKATARLFLTADAGYGLSVFHKDTDGYRTRGGMMLNPGVGLRLGKPDAHAFTLTFSYKHQRATVEKPPIWDQVERTEARAYNRLSVRLGVWF